VYPGWWVYQGVYQGVYIPGYLPYLPGCTPLYPPGCTPLYPPGCTSRDAYITGVYLSGCIYHRVYHTGIPPGCTIRVSHQGVPQGVYAHHRVYLRMYMPTIGCTSGCIPPGVCTRVYPTWCMYPGVYLRLWENVPGLYLRLWEKVPGLYLSFCSFCTVSAPRSSPFLLLLHRFCSLSASLIGRIGGAGIPLTRSGA